MAAAWLAGIVAASTFEIPPVAVGLFTLAAVLGLAFLAAERRALLPGVVLLVLVAGMGRVGLSGPDAGSQLATYHGRTQVLVEGTVVGDPERAGSWTRLRLSVDALTREGERLAVSGLVLVTLRPTPEIAALRDLPHFRYGDRLELDGILEAPPRLVEFDYPAFLARQGIDTVMSFPDVRLVAEGAGNRFYQWLYGVRHSMAGSLGRVMQAPQAAMGKALLLGLRDDLPDEQVDSFRRTGTSHILAISGLHVGILLGLTLAMSARVFGRRRHLYLLMPVVAVWLYALISGMSPSVTRAAIMGSVYLAALLVGRPRSVLPALGFAAALMVAVDPDILWTVSFQLSFAAVAGIAVIAEPLGTRLRSLAGISPGVHDRAGSWSALLANMVAVTVAATLSTLPLIVYYFGHVPLLGLPATLMVLPALPFVLTTQAAAGLVGLASTGAGAPLGWLAWASTSYVTGVVGLFAKVPGASVQVASMPAALVWAYYGLLGLAIWRGVIGRARSGSPALRVKGLARGPDGRPVLPWWMVTLVGVAGALVWIASLSLPDGRLHVAFLDVGQGDAVLITTPGGSQILVDGGPDPMAAVRLLGERMPFRDRSVELVVLTHAHDDHVGGLLEVLKAYDVQMILERRFDYASAGYEAWRRAIDAEDASVIQARAGQVIEFDDGLVIEALSPPDALGLGTGSDLNNASVVLRLVYGEISFLLTGDIESETEAVLAGEGSHIESNVLKVGHHGSRASSSRRFLERVSPDVAVISAGRDNRFGHPDAEAMETLSRYVPDDLILLTAERGTVELVTDGRRLDLITEH